MKKLLLIFLMMLLFSSLALSQITRIKDIQYTTDPSGDSPLNGQVVTISGIVTAEHRGDVKANGGISGSYFFMMDSAGAWSGIQVYFSDSLTAEGDSITVDCVADSYITFRQYRTALEESGRFSTPIPPPEGYPYTQSGVLKIEPKPGE